MILQNDLYAVLHLVVITICVWVFGYCVLKPHGWHTAYKRVTLWPLKALIVNPVKSSAKKNKKFLVGLAVGIVVAFWLMQLYNQTQQ